MDNELHLRAPEDGLEAGRSAVRWVAELMAKIVVRTAGRAIEWQPTREVIGGAEQPILQVRGLARVLRCEVRLVTDEGSTQRQFVETVTAFETSGPVALLAVQIWFGTVGIARRDTIRTNAHIGEAPVEFRE